MMHTINESEEPEKHFIKDSENFKLNSVKDVVYSLKPAFMCENIFGIFRFRIAENKLLPSSWKRKVLGIVIVASYVIYFTSSLKFPDANMRTIKIIVEIMDNVPPIIVLIQYIATVLITNFFICEKTVKIITLLADLDYALHIGMNENFYKKSRSNTIKYISVVVLLHFVFGTTDVVTDETGSIEEDVPYKILPILFYIEQDIEIFVFCKMVYMLSSRLRIINDYLTKFIEEHETVVSVFTVNKKDVAPEHSFNFIGRPSDRNNKIKELASMYDVMGEICSLINDIFNYQMFMNLVSTFSFIIITIWTSLYYFQRADVVDSKLTTVVLWCILTVLSVGVMAFSCEHLLTSRYTTRVLVNEIIMNYDLPRGMRVQAKVFMELIEAWPLRIFVYDMFSIDITLMLKFISVATTYLIVVIQVSHFI